MRGTQVSESISRGAEVASERDDAHQTILRLTKMIAGSAERNSYLSLLLLPLATTWACSHLPEALKQGLETRAYSQIAPRIRVFLGYGCVRVLIRTISDLNLRPGAGPILG